MFYFNFQDIICEAWVTFLFMTALTQSNMNFGETPAMATFIRSVMGLFVMALIDGYGHINYALFNPNLVISFIITQRLSIPKGRHSIRSILQGRDQYCFKCLFATLSDFHLLSTLL